MLVKKKIPTVLCRGTCGKILKRGDFKAKTIQGVKILVCKNCGYYHSSEILTTWVNRAITLPVQERLL